MSPYVYLTWKGAKNHDFKRRFRGLPQQVEGIPILFTIGWTPRVYVLGTKLVILGMVIPTLIGNHYNGYIKPYYWVDDHPLPYWNHGSFRPWHICHEDFCWNKEGALTVHSLSFLAMNLIQFLSLFTIQKFPPKKRWKNPHAKCTPWSGRICLKRFLDHHDP